MIEILDFYDDWCSACKALMPVIDEIKKKYRNISVSKIKVSEKPDMAQKYGVMGLPCIIILKYGEQVERFNSAVSREELFTRIDEYV